MSELLISSKYIEVLDINFSDIKLSDGIQFIVNGPSHDPCLKKLNRWPSIFSSNNVLSLIAVLQVNTI